MTKTDPVVKAFNTWHETVNDMYDAVRDALSEEDYDRATEIMMTITQQQAKISLQMRQAKP